MPGLPWLIRGLTDLTTAYPDARTGLGLAEERLLAVAPRDWTKTARVIVNAMRGADDNRRWFGDGALFERLESLAASSQPMPTVEMRGNGKEMRHTEVRITESARASLAGQRNLVRENGIDQWIGGVHHSSAAGRVWFRDAGGRLIDGRN